MSLTRRGFLGSLAFLPFTVERLYHKLFIYVHIWFWCPLWWKLSELLKPVGLYRCDPSCEIYRRWIESDIDEHINDFVKG
jgi:hypothetical protein